MNAERIKEIQSETPYPDSVSVQQALLKVWNECEQNPERQLEKISPSENDIILMKGEWTQKDIQDIATLAVKRGMNNIMVVVPDGKFLENMPIGDFYYLLKEVEKRIGIEPESDEVCGD